MGKGGREGIGGGNNVAGAAPAEFRFRTPPPRFDFGTSRRLPGASPDAGSGAAEAPRAPRREGSGGHRLAGAEELLAAGRPRQRRGRAVAPPEPYPSRTPGQGAGWDGRGKTAGGSAAAAKLGSPRAPLGGSSQAWLEEARPGSSARGSAPARGGLPGARRGVGRRGVSRRGGAPYWAPGAVCVGGVSAPTPCPDLRACGEGSRRSLAEGRSARCGATSSHIWARLPDVETI